MSVPTTAPAVEFAAVTKRFGNGPVVLENISLTVRPGDFVSLIGPSGCGKSTLLRLIAGLSPLSNGSIAIGGQPPNATADIGFVFQDPTLLPWLTVAKNVELSLRLRSVDRATRAAAARRALDLVGLPGRTTAYPRQLSGGQKMRVSLARALAASPKILLLDEPFGALDEMSRERLNEELLAIRQRLDWTAFFVTHSVAEAVFLSNRVLIMSANPGRIAAEVQVELPYPRTPDTRLSRPFQDLVVDVSRLLHGTMKAA